MLDTLLIAVRSRQRSFRVGVALDQDYPFRAAMDFLDPGAGGPDRCRASALGHLGVARAVRGKAIAVVQVEFVPATADGRGWGLSMILVETSGYAVRSRIRLFRDPIAARQTDLQGELIMDLPTMGDAVPIDLTPHEIARVEITLGS